MSLRLSKGPGLNSSLLITMNSFLSESVSLVVHNLTRLSYEAVINTY